jgi:nicotinate-nucleotide adenylyltransferase
MLEILAGGSSANPFTLGHYNLLNELRKTVHTDQIIWIPSGERSDKKLITSEHREAMTKLAIPTEWALTSPKLTVDYSDIYGENTPTFLWIKKLEFKYPGAEIKWFTEVDSVLPRREYGGKCEVEAKWAYAEELMRKSFIILPRAGYPNPSKLFLPDNFQVLDIPSVNISSTEVRDLISNRQPFEHLVPEKVSQYIKDYNLYGYQSREKEGLDISSPEMYSNLSKREKL